MNGAHEEAYPGSAADLRVEKGLHDGGLLFIHISSFLVRALLKCVDSFTDLAAGVKFLHDFEELLFFTLLIEINRRLMTEN